MISSHAREITIRKYERKFVSWKIYCFTTGLYIELTADKKQCHYYKCNPFNFSIRIGICKQA